MARLASMRFLLISQARLAKIKDFCSYRKLDSRKSKIFARIAISALCADMAQLAEQLICNQQVIGSSPIIGLYLFGRIPEWPKGADCKSVSNAFDGSNPSPPTLQ